MMFRRKRPIHYEETDGRTLIVIDRLERVADQIERLATEMEVRLQVRAAMETGETDAGS